MTEYKRDAIYTMLADGHPEIIKEIKYRACITYPKMSELVLVTIHRSIEDERNKLADIKFWISNTLEGLASKEISLEDELDRAYKSGKTSKQVIHQTFVDLQKVRDKDMRRKTRKYEPLIKIEDGFVYLTPDGERLFD